MTLSDWHTRNEWQNFKKEGSDISRNMPISTPGMEIGVVDASRGKMTIKLKPSKNFLEGCFFAVFRGAASK